MEQSSVNSERSCDVEPPVDAIRAPKQGTVSRTSWRAIGLFTLALLTISTTSGVAFGWPALRRQLIETNSGIDERSLSLIYISGAWATQGSRLFWGVTRDRYGARVTTIASVLICATGAVAMTMAQTTVGLAAALFCMGCGSGVQLTLQPVASLFQKQGWVISTFSGGFQISVLMFLVITSISSDRRISFGGFAAVLVLLSFIILLVVPNRFHNETSNDKTISVDGADRPSDILNVANVKVNDELEKMTPSANAKTSMNSDQTLSLRQQLCNSEYVLLVVWLSVLLVPMQYYIGTIGFQLEQRGDDEGKYSRAFSIVYAASAVAGPPMGYFADHLGVAAGQALASIFLAVSFFILANRDFSLPIHTVGMVCYGIGRMAAFAMYFTNVGKRFGFPNFGTLSGLGLLLSAIVSLVQYPLIAVATEEEPGMFDMANDVIANICCGCVTLLPLPYCLWLSFREQSDGANESPSLPN